MGGCRGKWARWRCRSCCSQTAQGSETVYAVWQYGVGQGRVPHGKWTNLALLSQPCRVPAGGSRTQEGGWMRDAFADVIYEIGQDYRFCALEADISLPAR